MKVAHIMIEERNDATPKELSANQEKLNQLLESLESGTSFEEMTKFSDDKGSAKNKGELPGLVLAKWLRSLNKPLLN